MIPRYKFCFCVTFGVLLISSRVCGSVTPVYKEALDEHLQDAAHNEGAESTKLEKQKADKVHEIESQINDSHKKQQTKINDEAKYLKKDHDTKSSSDSDAYQGYNAQQDKVEDSATSGYKRGHKKGHHKQGFQNSYHKDESSNKSTFFDDLNDEGDQAQYNSRLNSHDNQGGRTYKGAHNNGQEYVRDNHQGGGYNRYADSGSKYAGHQDHGKNHYLDDRSNYNRYNDDHNRYDRNKVHDRREFRAPPPPPPPLPPVHHDPGWDWQRWEDSRRGWDRPAWRDPAWERDYGGPGYYDDFGTRHDGGYGYGPNHGYGYFDESRTAPVAANGPVLAHRKETITIYEDPRYEGNDNGQLRREEGDHLQLEFKPSNHRYASNSYEDYYANNPGREGAMEASKINRLVYNYRRQ